MTPLQMFLMNSRGGKGASSPSQSNQQPASGGSTNARTLANTLGMFGLGPRAIGAGIGTAMDLNRMKSMGTPQNVDQLSGMSHFGNAMTAGLAGQNFGGQVRSQFGGMGVNPADNFGGLTRGDTAPGVSSAKGAPGGHSSARGGPGSSRRASGGGRHGPGRGF